MAISSSQHDYLMDVAMSIFFANKKRKNKRKELKVYKMRRRKLLNEIKRRAEDVEYEDICD